MASAPETRSSLLLRVRDWGDEQAWRQFVEIYGPLIYQFARKWRLQDSDAADLTQIVLQEVLSAVQRLEYDPERGSFRSWLYRVVRNQLQKLQTRQQRQPRGAGDTAVLEALHNHPERAADDESLWEREFERQLFLWAAEKVRGGFAENNWQAFWQTAVEDRSARDVAAALHMSVGAVYTAKSRVLDRIRKEIEQARENDRLAPDEGI